MKTFSLLLALILCTACAGSPTQARADFLLGVQYLNGTGGMPVDLAKAFTAFEKASDAGNADAKLALGYLYFTGKGVTQDNARGLELFTQAAELGNVDAQYNTGLAYVRGEVVTQDYAKAFTWFEKAALQGDAGAQYNLGAMLMNGEGTEADPLAAYVWFTLASEQGYEGAEEAMASAKTELSDEQLEEVDREVAKMQSRVERAKPSVLLDAEPVSGSQGAPL